MFRAYFTVLVVAFACAASAAAQTAEQVPAEDIAKLIRQLDAERFQERQEAVAALVAVGDPAIEPLQAAIDDKASSPELRLRAGEALKQLRTAAVKRSAVKLSDIVEQARLANRGKLDAERLEALLERLVQIISVDTGTEHVLPVRLADVADAGGVPETLTRKALIKMDAGRITSVQDSIVLAETAVDISSARNSIIIAGVSATVTSPRNCLIIAGRNVNVSSGGDKNIALSGGTLTGSIVSDAILGSAGTMQISIPRNVTFINLPEGQRAAFADARLAEARGERAPKMVDSLGILLEVKPRENALEGEIQITMALAASRNEPLALFRRKGGDGEYVARANKEICFPDGKPMPELAGWKLIYCGGGARQSGYAVFRKGSEQSILDVTP